MNKVEGVHGDKSSLGYQRRVSRLLIVECTYSEKIQGEESLYFMEVLNLYFIHFFLTGHNYGEGFILDYRVRKTLCPALLVLTGYSCVCM